MPQDAPLNEAIRSAKTMADAVYRWLDGQGGGNFHYRDDIWQALEAIDPERFEVTEERKTPWFSVIRALNGDGRFRKVRSGYYGLAREGGGGALRERVREVLNDYMASTEAGREHVDDEALLKGQRENFLERFGPQRLREMARGELLHRLPLNAEREQPMDYWLEFKDDDEFESALFGSISGGSAAKYGTWQEKEKGHWRAKLQGSKGIENIGEARAEELVERRRREILAASEVCDDFRGMAYGDIDPASFQAAIEEAAPRWHGSAWLHKYLHLAAPELVTWNSTQNYSDAELSRLGMVPPGEGMYANDILIIRFWTGLPALQGRSAEMCYRVARGMGPHKHWCFGVDEDRPEAWREMVDGGYLGLGPSGVGDLGEVFRLAKKGEIQMAVESSFEDAGRAAEGDEVRNLVELAYRLEEGRFITLFSGTERAVAVGEVVGDYRFAEGESRPHRVPVAWRHHRSFETGYPLGESGRLVRARHKDGVVADIEASLVVNGFGPWPGFLEHVGGPLTGKLGGRSSAPREDVELPELEALSARIADMVERKHQVILYGPPGTGKTYHAERVAREIVARHNFGRPYARLTKKQSYLVDGASNQRPYVESCTFHPMYAYEDFIEGYRPQGDGFSLEPGIFKRMANVASQHPDERYVLIIDEINRGNIPRIFGELITLIESTRRGKSRARLPLSGDAFCVPENLYLIGTMNTADRSIMLLDTALRRRFGFVELMPDPKLLSGGTIGDVSLAAWLRALNRRIVDQLGRDGRNLQIGHSYLMTRQGKPLPKLERVADAVRDEIWPLLQEYCYEDPHKLSNILGRLYDEEQANLRYELFEEGREQELVAALRAIVRPEDKKQDAEEVDVEDDVAEDVADDEEELA